MGNTTRRDGLARGLGWVSLALGVPPTLAPGGFAGARGPWDGVGAALIRPDGHLAWAADRESGVDVGAEAAAALLRWLPGLGR